MEKSNAINPHITLLKRGHLERIHSDSLKILSDVGVRIDSRRARKIFSRLSPPFSTSTRKPTTLNPLAESIWKTEEIISGLKAPDDHAELMAKGLEFIRKIEG